MKKQNDKEYYWKDIRNLGQLTHEISNSKPPETLWFAMLRVLKSGLPHTTSDDLRNGLLKYLPDIFNNQEQEQYLNNEKLVFVFNIIKSTADFVHFVDELRDAGIHFYISLHADKDISVNANYTDDILLSGTHITDSNTE